ncbi:tyrosine-type recombinase/integrase [Enterococcus sp. LJL128]
MASFEEYTKKNGEKLWRFHTYLGVDPSTGKQIRTTRGKFKRKKDAVLAEKRLQNEVIENGFSKPTATTFNEVYELWLVSYKSTVKEATSIATERYMQIHVLPIFKNQSIDKINLKQAQAAVNKWAEKLQVYNVVLQYVIQIMNYAINLELINSNPFEHVIRPAKKMKNKEKQLKTYDLEQLKILFRYLDKKVNSISDSSSSLKYFAEYDRILYRFLTYTGLRGGEASALMWNDINFTEKTVTINKTMSQTKTGFTVSSPKTKSSYRTISIDDKTLRMLKSWQLRQKEMLFANRINNNEIVFPTIDGQHNTRQGLYQRSSRIAKKAGLPNIGTHGFRHTHASLLFEAGASMKEAQERLGHSSISMTMDIYTHVTKKTRKETAEKLERFANL